MGLLTAVMIGCLASLTLTWVIFLSISDSIMPLSSMKLSVVWLGYVMSSVYFLTIK